MNNYDNIIFEILKHSLFGGKSDFASVSSEKKTAQASEPSNLSELSNLADLTKDDWNAIFKELRHQTVAGLPLEYLVQNIDLPDGLKDKLTLEAFAMVGAWTKLMEAQKSLLELLDQNNIDTVIIKGSAAAMNYPKPEYRSMGDVDFIVRADDFEKVAELMLANGYAYELGDVQANLHIKGESYHHVEFVKDGVTFELHKHMSDTMQDPKINDRMRELTTSGMNHIVTSHIGPYEFPTFDTNLNGLIFIRHIIQHMHSGGIGLRHLIDWMMFVDRHLDDKTWNDSFEAWADSLNLKDTAKVFAKICQKYLGLRTDDITWCADADDELCDFWMNQIMSSGNFGRKNKKEDEGATVLTKNKNIFTFLGSLQRLGVSNWKSAHKHEFLVPFAWFYQICHYIRKGLFRKSPIKSLKKDIAKSKDKKDMLGKLNL